MKVLVCGGRNYADYDKVCTGLADAQITFLINGGASGADSLSTIWANENSIPYKVYPARWFKYGNSAGYKRNAEMLELHPDIELVVAFPGGTGTADMIRQAKKKQIPVWEIP